jgi:hypothetical protein
MVEAGVSHGLLAALGTGQRGEVRKGYSKSRLGVTTMASR